MYRDLPAQLKQEVIAAYYGPEGIGFSPGRIPIRFCDFSEKPYTFDNTAGDVSLSYFDDDVTYDQSLCLPLIRDALAACCCTLPHGARPPG